MRVAVLGGGPAAGAAALRLARGGLEATLFHPERRGEKPCGGAVPGYLIREIEGFDAALVPSVAVRQARLENAAGRLLELDLSGLRIFRRADFDRALVDAAIRAGAVRRAEKVRRLDWRAGSPRLETDSGRREFDWVIAADGARGLSRRALGLHPCGESIGLGASIPGLEVEVLTLGFPHLGDAYLWIFPRPGGCSVGIAYSESKLSTGAARSCLSAFLERHLSISFDEILGSRYRYPIPVYSSAVREALTRALARGILLAGDAASLADPLTREGIRYAVRSGRWAAEALLEGSPQGYGERLIDEMDGDLRRALRARELFFEDPVGQWMVPVCDYHPGIRRVLSDLLTGEQPYRGLRRRLLGAALGAR